MHVRVVNMAKGEDLEGKTSKSSPFGRVLMPGRREVARTVVHPLDADQLRMP